MLGVVGIFTTEGIHLGLSIILTVVCLYGCVDYIFKLLNLDVDFHDFYPLFANDEDVDSSVWVSKLKAKVSLTDDSEKESLYKDYREAIGLLDYAINELNREAKLKAITEANKIIMNKLEEEIK